MYDIENVMVRFKLLKSVAQCVFEMYSYGNTRDDIYIYILYVYRRIILLWWISSLTSVSFLVEIQMSTYLKYFYAGIC